jgi:hypothetical protein
MAGTIFFRMSILMLLAGVCVATVQQPFRITDSLLLLAFLQNNKWSAFGRLPRVSRSLLGIRYGTCT